MHQQTGLGILERRGSGACSPGGSNLGGTSGLAAKGTPRPGTANRERLRRCVKPVQRMQTLTGMAVVGGGGHRPSGLRARQAPAESPVSFVTRA